ASLVVALIYLPVMGGVAGRATRKFERIAVLLKPLPWALRAALVVPAMATIFVGAMLMLNPGYLSGTRPADAGILASVPGAAVFMLGAILGSITLEAAKPASRLRPIRAGYRRSPFGHLINFIAGNPVMPLVTIAGVVFVVISVFGYYGQHSKGVEFFVESETEQAIIYLRARGNLSLEEKDAILREAESIVLDTPGIHSVFAFAGQGGIDQNNGGAQAPLDTVAQVQVEMQRWETRKDNPELDGDLVLDRLVARLEQIPGIRVESLSQSRGPASGKPLHLRLTGDDFAALDAAVRTVETKFAALEGVKAIEDTRPLPGIDWQIDVDVEKAGRYGADVATVGGMVQLVTRGILLDTMRVDSSDEEIEIRVRLPEQDRFLSTLDTLKVRTGEGLVPLANFVTRHPVPKLGRIDRFGQKRYFDVKADVETGITTADGQPVNANERIAVVTKWLEEENPLPAGVDWQWTGDQEEQAESQAFLMKAFAGALGLMFVILLAQFNSFYNTALVLIAVVLSTTGVLIGMLVMDQTFSIIMTGTGIVALAGIVVNNNIVLIDTYQEFSQYMPRIEAITRTAEARIRPVLLTTITTMAGLAPMMFGLSLDFFGGGYSVDSPTALWWKQLATAVVFGLGIATVLTLVLTPSLLALRVWIETGAFRSVRRLQALSMGAGSRAARDLALAGAARKLGSPEILWDEEPQAPVPAGTGEDKPVEPSPLRAAE
ncbi:MAG: efflux RND transporter permease subunit, partial [Rhodobacteraceae bacterium]|nr:efflux RND transporter permease subunit [Paracoccaceae bacterium]